MLAASSAENYFRITLYNQFLSHMIGELEERFTVTPMHRERFTVTPMHSIGLLMLMPHECTKRDRDSELPDELSQVTDFYKTDLPHQVMLSNEYRMWVTKWKHPEKLISSVIQYFSPTFMFSFILH